MIQRESDWSRWFAAGRAGDARAYQRFLTDIAVYLRKSLQGRLQPDQSEDVVQEVLLAVHKARHTWNETEPVTAWLHGILRYKTADYFRSLYRVQGHETHNEHAYETFAAPLTNTLEDKDRAAHVLQGLNPKQKALLVLTKVEGLTAAETGQRLGMTPTAVKVAVHRLLKQLQLRHGGNQ